MLEDGRAKGSRDLTAPLRHDPRREGKGAGGQGRLRWRKDGERVQQEGRPTALRSPALRAHIPLTGHLREPWRHASRQHTYRPLTGNPLLEMLHRDARGRACWGLPTPWGQGVTSQVAPGAGRVARLSTRQKTHTRPWLGLSTSGSREQGEGQEHVMSVCGPPLARYSQPSLQKHVTEGTRMVVGRRLPQRPAFLAYEPSPTHRATEGRAEGGGWLRRA